MRWHRHPEVQFVQLERNFVSVAAVESAGSAAGSNVYTCQGADAAGSLSDGIEWHLPEMDETELCQLVLTA